MQNYLSFKPERVRSETKPQTKMGCPRCRQMPAFSVDGEAHATLEKAELLRCPSAATELAKTWRSLGTLVARSMVGGSNQTQCASDDAGKGQRSGKWKIVGVVLTA